MGVEGAEQAIGDRTRQWLHSDNRLNLTGSITTGFLMTCQIKVIIKSLVKC